MKRFNKIFAVCLTLSVLGGSLLPSPWTCGGFTDPVPIEVQADGEPTTIDSGIGVLITMLLANGIRFVGNFDDTVKPGIQKLWDDFTTATGNTVTLATLGAQSVVQLGYLRTSSAVNNAVNAFQQWYTNNFSVTNNSSVEIPVASGSSVYFTAPDTRTNIPGTSFDWEKYGTDPRILFFLYGSTIGVYVWSTSRDEGAIFYDWRSGSYFTTDTAYNGYFYFPRGDINTMSYPTNQCLNALYGIYGGITLDHFPSYAEAWEYAYGQYSGGIGDISMQGESLKLIDGYDISNDQSRLLDIAGIQDLVGTLGLTLDSVNDLIDSIPLIMDYPWADTFPDDPTFADTPDDAIPWVDVPTAVVPSEVPEYVPETPADEGSYKVLGLERVFPFSIPFDFIAVVNLLNAEPVCPEFTFRVYNPISGQNIDAKMSFERFEGVAQVIRIVETIGFIVFLILITRSLIRS